MLINITLGCEIDQSTGGSECGLVLAALADSRDIVKQNPQYYGDKADGVIAKLDSIAQSINDAMLAALESLEPVQVYDDNNGYSTVYVVRETLEGGRAE